ncbi:fungal-specific transcription factor domain-containing protein [Xylariaceae sp. FL1272]|nr:fungal-specific transcription factor domain-containing protein [Xylariaceae sp. FL1272]
MESRGNAATERPSRNRLAIPRKSCDQCRARKVGCNRQSPCANCTSSKLDCTFSTVAPKATIAKQRVLVSEKYEKKIDEIAEGIGDLKILIKELDSRSLSQRAKEHRETSHHLPPSPGQTGSSSEGAREIAEEPIVWDHSAQVTAFVRTIAGDEASREILLPESDILTTLKNLARTLDDNVARDLTFPEIRGIRPTADLPMPPAEAAILALRWARDHQSLFRIESIGRILPLETFTNICRKVYFAVDGYSDIEFILANGYLSYIFSEYVGSAGEHDLRAYCKLCRQNAQLTLTRIPLLLPATMETIAALAFGATFAVETSRATLAWAYISNAASLVQSLRLHRLATFQEDKSILCAKINLFWLVYLLDKTLALRLGRMSNIQDTEINTPRPENIGTARCADAAKIQGKLYEQLYSPKALKRSDVERSQSARVLATELEEIIAEIKEDCLESPPIQYAEDVMRVVYFKVELVKQLSLLSFIYRAIPTPAGSPTTITDESVAAAREALEWHHQCMMAVRGCIDSQFMMARYVNWGITHMPFMPFSILFTRIIQLADDTDLGLLDRFTESLLTDESFVDSVTHPYRLYSTLSQAAKLYIQRASDKNRASSDEFVDPWSIFDFASLGTENNNDMTDTEMDGYITPEMTGWYYGNQRFMSLLDDDVMF